MNTAKEFDYHHLVAIPRPKLRVIRSEMFAGDSRVFRFQNKLKKVLFFLVREGIEATLRKIHSARKDGALENDFVYVTVQLEGGWFASGFQHSSNQDVYYFLPSSFTRSADSHNDLRHANPFVYAESFPVSPEQQAATASYPYRAIESGFPGAGEHNLLMIGCGGYPRAQVLPIFEDFTKLFAVDFNPAVLLSRDLQGFKATTTDFRSIFRADLSRGKINLGIIASYHSYHTEQAIEILTSIPNSKVIIEKPPCVTELDLARLTAVYDRKRIFIGYNRRFIPWNWKVKQLLSQRKEPFLLQILVHESQITAAHWYYAPNQGTRVSGNLCHWVDLSIFLLGKKPVTLTIAKNPVSIDNSVFNILFEDGSTASLIATEYGDGTYGVRESITILGHEIEVKINDYTSMTIWDRGKTSHYRTLRRDKGHRLMYQTFKKKILEGGESDYTEKDLVYSTTAYLELVRLYQSADTSCTLDFGKFPARYK